MTADKDVKDEPGFFKKVFLWNRYFIKDIEEIVQQQRQKAKQRRGGRVQGNGSIAFL